MRKLIKRVKTSDCPFIRLHVKQMGMEAETPHDVFIRLRPNVKHRKSRIKKDEVKVVVIKKVTSSMTSFTRKMAQASIRASKIEHCFNA